MTEAALSPEVVNAKALATLDVVNAPMSWETLKAIAKTEFVPKGLRNKPEAILAAIRYGSELGLSPMVSLQEINVIDGNPTPTASLLSALVRNAGHRIVPVEVTDQRATARGERLDEDGTPVESFEYTFTAEMAKRAGLLSKSNWKNWPEAMLFWRAVTMVTRLFFPEVITGVKYLPEELGDTEWVEPVQAIGMVETDTFTTSGALEIRDDGGPVLEVASEVTEAPKVSLADAIANVKDAFVDAEIVDGDPFTEDEDPVEEAEVVEDPTEELYGKLFTFLGQDTFPGTKTDTMAWVESVYGLMHALELWPEDALTTGVAKYAGRNDLEASTLAKLKKNEVSEFAGWSRTWAVARIEKEQEDA